jgi:hypothetical protein
LKLSLREIATLSAALLYWREEMPPHGRQIMLPYFRQLGISRLTPLNRREIDRLAGRLREQTKFRR